MTDPQPGNRADRDPAQFSSWQRVIESLIRVAGHHQDHGTYFEQGKANAYFDAASSVDLIRSNAVRVSSATSVPRPVIPATYTRSPMSIAGELVRFAPGRVLRFCAPKTPPRTEFQWRTATALNQLPRRNVQIACYYVCLEYRNVLTGGCNHAGSKRCYTRRVSPV